MSETMHPPHAAHVDWRYSGRPDPMTGNGATGAERALLLAAGLSGAAVMVFLSLRGWVGWHWWMTGLAALIAFDLVGGAVAGALNSSKRFYFSLPKENERGVIRWLKGGYYLPLIQVHPVLVYLVYAPQHLITGIGLYVALGGASILVRQAPLYLARPLAMCGVLAAILANAYFIPSVAGFEWMVPALALKLLIGYAVREEPYRPEPNSG